MDETLLHASETKTVRPFDFRCGPYFVTLRPFLHDFLRTCSEVFQLAVWSSSSADYLHAVLEKAIPGDTKLKFIWSRQRCVHRFDPEWHTHYFVKDLKKVKRRGYNLARVLIADDTPKKLERNYGNAIYVKPFLGQPNDNELRLLARYLRTLTELDDVRPVEKRGWRAFIQ